MSFDLFSGFDSSDLMSKVPQEPIKKDYTDSRFWKISKNDGTKALIRGES